MPCFKRFYLGIHVLNDHPFSRKQFVKPFLSLAQLMLLTCFFRYPTVRMQLFYPKTGVYTDCLVKRFPNTVLIHLEILFAPWTSIMFMVFCSMMTCVYAAFSYLNTPLFGFLGRFIGLSVLLLRGNQSTMPSARVPSCQAAGKVCLSPACLPPIVSSR
ncbi:hypothetical protein Holit_00326 [Hollandina sp. SP2]